MASSTGSAGTGSVLRVIVLSAAVAGMTSWALTGWLGADRPSTPSSTQAAANASKALQGAGPPGAGRHEAAQAASPAAIVTGTVRKDKPRYLDAVWNELHFRPAIDTATNEQCLSCHQEILTQKVRKAAPAGIEANATLAWYQTLDTYTGDQETFHARHLTTPLAQKVMNLKCSFCHAGQDPRDETANTSATVSAPQVGNAMRKMVDPSSSCLLCHGTFPVANMGLEGSWSELREGFESEDTPNGCMACHAEQFRTVRHQVNYLKADAIEELAKSSSSDLCYGCHGGRAWYRISYDYPRHPWPGMDAEVPEWAKERPTQSKPEHRLKK